MVILGFLGSKNEPAGIKGFVVVVVVVKMNLLQVFKILNHMSLSFLNYWFGNS
jgi:hypothetical protein